MAPTHSRTVATQTSPSPATCVATQTTSPVRTTRPRPNILQRKCTWAPTRKHTAVRRRLIDSEVVPVPRFPTERMDAAENDTRRRASEKRIQLEQKRNAAEARRELKGSFREPHNLRPCACCSHPFEACKLTVQVQNHAIILKKRSWDPAVKIDPRDEAAARMYDLKRICVFCAQFFESTGDDLRRTTSLPIATEREKQDAASSQKAGAFVSRRGSVVIAGGDVGRSPAPRTRHTARKKLPQP